MHSQQIGVAGDFTTGGINFSITSLGLDPSVASSYYPSLGAQYGGVPTAYCTPDYAPAVDAYATTLYDGKTADHRTL